MKKVLFRDGTYVHCTDAEAVKWGESSEWVSTTELNIKNCTGCPSFGMCEGTSDEPIVTEETDAS